MRQPYYWKWCFILVLILAGGVLLMRAGDPRIENVIQCIGQALSISFVVILGWLIQIFSRRTNLFGSKRANSIFGIVFSVIFISIAGYVFVHCVPQGFLPREEVALNSYAAPVRYLISSFFITMLCYIVFTNIDTANKLQQTLLENEQFKHAHLRAQLISLKQQISPHFLFNSLSTLKTMATEKETKTFIVQLAHVYRYLLNSNAHDVLKLSEELKFITSYLYILHYKYSNNLELNADLPRQVMLRKSLSKNSWASFGSSLSGTVAFFSRNQPSIPGDSNFSILDLKTGPGFECRLGKRLMVGVNAGILTPLQAREFETNEDANDYFLKHKINSTPFLNFTISALPFL